MPRRGWRCTGARWRSSWSRRCSGVPGWRRGSPSVRCWRRTCSAATGVAGLPTALFTLGSARGGPHRGSRSRSGRGRRLGLAGGFLVGALGAVGHRGGRRRSTARRCCSSSLFVYGSGTATNLQARYAGTDLAPADQRATAVSHRPGVDDVGAVAGPNLVEPLGHLATRSACPPWPGRSCSPPSPTPRPPRCCSSFLRPDPLLVARGLADRRRAPTGRPTDAPTPAAAARRQRASPWAPRSWCSPRWRWSRS